MIRAMSESEIDSVMDIWLTENISAHDFITEDFWRSNFETVKTSILKSKIFVYEKDSEIIGFIGLSGNYIEGIFVKSKYQSKGIGKGLLKHCKKIFWSLNLKVYEKNQKAVKFYTENLFSIKDRMKNAYTNQNEFCMEWIK